ncbi:MAG: hypothetical protein WCL48_08510 [Betaproteobacteria bacterium]
MNNNTMNQESCKTCHYVLHSESSSTGLRCGYEYFHGSLIFRKVRLMSFYPSIHHYNLCDKFLPPTHVLETKDSLSV